MHTVLSSQTTSPILHYWHVQPMLHRWALELQQFDIKFQHIQGKRNVVADAISGLRTLGLYQDNDNEDVPSAIEDVVKNIIEELLLQTQPQRSQPIM